MSEVRGLGLNSQSVKVCQHLLPGHISVPMRIVGLRLQGEMSIENVDVRQGEGAIRLPLL